MRRQERTIVARFANMESAQEALKDLGGKDEGVQRGSVLLRDASGSVYARELDERTLSEIARNGFDLGAFVIAGGLGIIVVAAASTADLLLRSTGRALALTGSVVKAPIRKVQGILTSDSQVKSVGETLSPGSSALVVNVDADRSAEVAARLTAHGGLVELPTA